MVKVQIVGHREGLDRAVAALQATALLHLVDVGYPGLLPTQPATDRAREQEAEELSHLLTRLDGLDSVLCRRGWLPAIDPVEGVEPTVVDPATLRAQLDALAPRVEAIVASIDGLLAEESSLPRHLGALGRLAPLVRDIPIFDGYETIVVLVEHRHRAVLRLLEEELEGLTGRRFEMATADVGAQQVGAAIVVPREVAASLRAALDRERVGEVRLPSGFEALSFGEAIDAMGDRISAIPAEIEGLRRELEHVVAGQRAGWDAARAALAARLAQLQALRSFRTTARTFVASGWLPRERLDLLRDALAERLGTVMVIEEIAPQPGEQAPVVLANPAPARSFESLVGLLSLPQAGSLDPTLLTSIFLPFFLGLMLGDVVYGAVLLVAALLARRRWQVGMVADVRRVLALGAMWSVAWGFAFGEALGDLGERAVGLQPIWFDRGEAIEQLLVLSLVVGAAHVTLGLLLGAWVAWRRKAGTVLAERVGTLVALSGLYLLAAVAAERLPEGVVTPAGAAVIVGTIVLAAAKGALGPLLAPVELLGTVGNVLSYLRLAAIGLASVYLARVANELGTTGPVWLGLIVATLFHGLNLVLGMFTPTIQALRLHYVEFYGKFFEEGGTPYTPFGAGGAATAARVVGRPGIPAQPRVAVAARA